MESVRADHEKVAKITRPTAKGGTKRARGNVATLILGDDQRVRSDAAEAAAPVKKPAADRLHRVKPKPALKIVRPETDVPAAPQSAQTQAAQPMEPAPDFARFADQIGASTLHELLEASAAYLAIVEDQPRFSQDSLIDNITQYLGADNVSSDAANRSLNRLLRDGRILRVKQDRYTISKSARHGFQSRLAG